MGKRAEHTIGCPVIIEYPVGSNRIVLVGEPKKGNSLNLPGGGVDLIGGTRSEELTVCAIREAYEETGLEIDVNKNPFGIDHILNDNKIHFTFVASKIIKGELQTSTQHPIICSVDLNEITELSEMGMLRSHRVFYWAKLYLLSKGQEDFHQTPIFCEFIDDPHPINDSFKSLNFLSYLIPKQID